MKLRARWYCIAPGVPALRRIAEAMQAEQYGRRRSSGFRLDEVRRDHIDGRFIERVEWDDTVEDPVGGQLVVHRIELRQARFRLSTAEPELEVLDAPRSLGNLGDALSRCFGETVRLQDVNVLPDTWLRELEERIGKVTVTALSTCSFSASARTSVTMAFSGTDDVRKHIARFTNGSEVGVARLVGTLASPHRGRVDLIAGARAALHDVDGAAIHAVRESLRASMIKTTGERS